MFDELVRKLEFLSPLFFHLSIHSNMVVLGNASVHSVLSWVLLWMLVFADSFVSFLTLD